MRHLRSIVAATALALSTGVASAESPIVIGVPTGLSGTNSTVAPAVVQSTQLAVKEINDKGGILGRKVTAEFSDDESGATGAQRAFHDLILEKKANVLISMETSAARNAGMPAVEKYKVPYIYTSQYEGYACSKYLFVDADVPQQDVNPMVDYFMNDKKAKSFFLLGSDYAFGRGMLKYTRQYIAEKGGKVVGEEYQPMDATDWTSIISQIRRANPDAIVMGTGGGSPNVTFLRQYATSGIEKPIGSLSLDAFTAQSLGGQAAGVYLVGSYFTDIKSDANQAFLKRMKDFFGSKLLTPSSYSVPQYDAVFLYKAAVEKAGTADADAVVKALPTVSFSGPRGTVSMNKEHHTALTMYLAQIGKDGKISIVKAYDNVDPGNQCPGL
ncbi:MAG: amino acid ABC transporter [Candidimonas sp.]|nr:MAG: amino acid ABC transporter [Candidimonas sp.]